MTCIVALKHNDKIFMGGDSLGSSSYTKAVRLDEKVFVKDDMIFGFCGSFRMGQILQYVMTSPERPVGISDMKYLVAYWIPNLIDVFHDAGYRGDKGADDHEETRTGGQFLLGYKGTLYGIDSDFQVAIPADQYASIGSGQEFALGSIYTSKKAGVKDPIKILTVALEAAETFANGVQQPFLFVSN